MKDRFSRGLEFYVSCSFAFHILFIITFIAIGAFLERNKDKQKKLNIKLIEASVRVDLVAMPTMSIQELKKLSMKGRDATKKSTKNNSMSKNNSDLTFEKKTKKRSFMDMLKNQAAKNIKNEKVRALDRDTPNNQVEDSGDKLSKEERDKLKNLVLSGNKLSKGTLIVGSGPSSGNFEFSEYMTELVEKVRTKWKLPSYLLSEDLKCRIQIFLNKNGSLIHTKIYESSGNKEYDRRALEAIKLTSPFSPLPKKLEKSALNGEIVLGFPL